MLAEPKNNVSFPRAMIRADLRSKVDTHPFFGRTETGYRICRCSLIVLSAVVLGIKALGGTVGLSRSPLLGATLPNGTTYEVEVNTNGSWIGSGVMIAGNGSSNVVRLDGYPEAAAYRLGRVGTGDIVVPSVSYGLHLSASESETNEVRFVTAPSVAAADWTDIGMTLPNTTGQFIKPLKPPSAAQAFFRSLTPAEPETWVSLGAYSVDPTNTPLGFGLVVDDMPEIYRNCYIAAPCSVFFNRDGQNAAAAGECYELQGPVSNVTVMVADYCPTPPAGTCDAGRAYFDLGPPAFAALFPPDAGHGLAPCRLVPAPVTGNVKLVVRAYSGYYIGLCVYNHRAGISKLEIRGPSAGGTGGNWMELPRASYNTFEFSGATPAGFPLEVRVTSRFGEVVTFPAIASMDQNSRFVANAQFEVFPALRPSLVWVPQPVYTDALGSMPGGRWWAFPWSASVDPGYKAAAYSGTASLCITNLAAWGGVTFQYQQRFPPATDAFLELAAKSANGSTISNLVVRFSGRDGQGAPVDSATVALPPIGAAWRVLRIPLQPTQAPEQVGAFSVVNNSATSQPPVLLDAVSFVQR